MKLMNITQTLQMSIIKRLDDVATAWCIDLMLCKGLQQNGLEWLALLDMPLRVFRLNQ